MPNDESTAETYFRLVREVGQHRPVSEVLCKLVDTASSSIRIADLNEAARVLCSIKKLLHKIAPILDRTTEQRMRTWEEIMQLRRENVELQIEIARIRRDEEAANELEGYLSAIHKYEREYFTAALKYLEV